MNLTKEAVYEALVKAMTEWNWVQGRDMDLGISITQGEIGLYTSRRDGFPVRFTADGVWTFRSQVTPEMTADEYARMCVSTLIERSRSIPGKVSVDFPSNASILQSKRRKEYESMSDSDYTAFIRYMFATQQTCSECQVGEIDVDVGSYSEVHTCINCGDGNVVD